MVLGNLQKHLHIVALMILIAATICAPSAHAVKFHEQDRMLIPIGLALLEIRYVDAWGKTVSSVATGFVLPSKKLVTAAHFLRKKNIVSIVAGVWNGEKMEGVQPNDFGRVHPDQSPIEQRMLKYLFEVDVGVLQLPHEMPTSFKLPAWSQVKDIISNHMKQIKFHGFSAEDGDKLDFAHFGGRYSVGEWRVSAGYALIAQDSRSAPLRLHLEARRPKVSLSNADSGGPLYFTEKTAAGEVNFPVAIASFVTRERGQIFANSFQVLTPKVDEWIQTSCESLLQ
jgi:hypothetical protein